MNTFEEQYMDVLHNIEFALINMYRENAAMTDYEALEAINGLIRTYTAESRRRSAPELKLNELAQAAYDGMQAMCELHMGRATLTSEEGETQSLPVAIITMGEVLQCLKRIRRSIERWNKERGRRGYFDVVGKYVL
jgi:hypothetical protein